MKPGLLIDTKKLFCFSEIYFIMSVKIKLRKRGEKWLS